MLTGYTSVTKMGRPGPHAEESPPLPWTRPGNQSPGFRPRPPIRGLVDKRHVTHGYRFGFGIHDHPVPSIQADRLVIGMANLAADEDAWVATLCDPRKVSQLWLLADQLLVLLRRQSIRILRTYVNQLSALTYQLFTDVRLATARLIGSLRSTQRGSMCCHGWTGTKNHSP